MESPISPDGGTDDGETGTEEVTYLRVYDSDADRVHDVKRRDETYPDVIRRILDDYEE